MREIAYAKINLALHVRRRREDGYHDIETLFAFVDVGDVLEATPAPSDQLTIVGEFASQLTDPFNNLVTKALGHLSRSEGLRLTLEKNLPVAAGLGGGSADAGAVFRIVDQLHGLPDDWRTRAAKLGADVPACVESYMCVGSATGTELTPINNDLAATPVLLVNPRIPLATGPVFAGWDGIDRGPLPDGPASAILRAGRNDLQPSAITIVPQIGQLLASLNATDAMLTRMSGSGATCFALYATEEAREAAARKIAAEHPDWWQLSGKLRP
ncbi:4-(cytidine 5'-diphospho)-2-C-methyl-D-erythritol kinase [Tsuneonella deserti]|uniref:4-(cytidine 5'-diphospho)-2-C-methyl-D-erythritol kinase n=1 Tax=Tsuneonella deserti TaxID=2035528 RepID=UPI001E387914|nr:4-(cytidine 5'-diphospho)-2-C-methyl-D-erythritol kinase [Tsuneonella deserti]